MIDTLATSRKLRTSGFPKEQAEALTEVIADNQSVEIKRMNKKIDVLDNNIRDLQKSTDYRFEKIDEKFEKIDEKFERLDNKIDNVAKELNVKIDSNFEKLDNKIEKLDNKIEKFRTDFTSQSRWIIGLIVTLIIAMGILKFI